MGNQQFGGQKAFTDGIHASATEKFNKGPWERIAEEALRLIDKNPDIDQRLKAKAQLLIADPNFRKRIKDGWDNDTLRGIVNKDPEKQEKLWARGLAEIIAAEPPSSKQ